MSVPLDRIREGMRVRATYTAPGAGIDWTGTALQTVSLGGHTILRMLLDGDTTLATLEIIHEDMLTIEEVER